MSNVLRTVEPLLLNVLAQASDDSFDTPQPIAGRSEYGALWLLAGIAALVITGVALTLLAKNLGKIIEFLGEHPNKSQTGITRKRPDPETSRTSTTKNTFGAGTPQASSSTFIENRPVYLGRNPDVTPQASSRIFISYRRSDSIREAGRIYDYLENRFGRDAIFKDVDTIDAGDDFRDRVKEAVGQCQILLAVIGANWLKAEDEAGRQRLENPADWVRLEIETALNRNIRVIPILLDGVPMPRPDDLPVDLQALAYRNAAPVRHDPDFRRDMDRLLRVIERHFKNA